MQQLAARIAISNLHSNTTKSLVLGNDERNVLLCKSKKWPRSAITFGEVHKVIQENAEFLDSHIQ
jgi:ribonucleoside-diphosphate reductase alpha chain